MKLVLLEEHIQQLENELVGSVVMQLIREVEVTSYLAGAEFEAASLRELAERRTCEADAVRRECEQLAVKAVEGGEVAQPGSLLQQFKIRADRAKAQQEAARMAESVTQATSSLTNFKASREQ